MKKNTILVAKRKGNGLFNIHSKPEECCGGVGGDFYTPYCLEHSLADYNIIMQTTTCLPAT